MPVSPTKITNRLSFGFPALDKVFSGFELGDFAVLDGNMASFASFVLCVRSQFAPENGGLGSSIFFVDGGNLFNPHLIAEISRNYRFNPKSVLEKIHVSRAFTAHQLSSMISEKLHFTLKKCKARILVISDITSLFLDRDMPATESRALFIRACSMLSEITSKKKAVVIVSYFPERRVRQMLSLLLEFHLSKKCNVLARLNRKGDVIIFCLERHHSIKPFSMNFTLDEIRSATSMDV